MELLRERAYQIRGIGDPPPIEPPARPTMLPVQPLDVTVEQAGEGPGVYGYWYRVGYRSAGAPPGARYLRIEFPDLAVAQTPQLDRVEIEYLPG